MSDECCNVPAPARTSLYFPDEIILYGVRLNSHWNYANFYAGTGQELRVEMVSTGSAPQSASSIVLAYGYAYEGHCYRFDKTRVFITEATEENPVGCGFDVEPRPPLPAPPNPPLIYRMWRIRAATELLELSTNYDTAQALILDANLPGRRAPNTYSITMQMAHRGGRLTRE
jgi:hypothetical protein